MSTVGQIRDAIATTIDDAIPDVPCYPKAPPGAPNLPSIWVQPDTAEFDMAFGMGTDEWNFEIVVLVGRTVEGASQDVLDEFLDGQGARSIRKIIWENSGVGLGDVDVRVTGMKGYGGRYRDQGVQVTGAILTATAVVSG